MNAGRLFNDDGTVANTACGRLLQFLRKRSGHWFSGMDIDVKHFSEHNVRAASTRKSEINHQCDPRLEWIEHKVERAAGRNLHYYRHTWTNGKQPTLHSGKDRALYAKRMAGAPSKGARCAARHAAKSSTKSGLGGPVDPGSLFGYSGPLKTHV